MMFPKRKEIEKKLSERQYISGCIRESLCPRCGSDLRVITEEAEGVDIIYDRLIDGEIAQNDMLELWPSSLEAPFETPLECVEGFYCESCKLLIRI